MRSKASSVSTSESVARMAASERTLAASVPPTPPTSACSRGMAVATRSATASENP
jgi:hypothetical protein